MAELTPVSGDEPYGQIYEPLLPAHQTISSEHRGPILIVISAPLIIIASLTVIVRLWTVFTITRSIGLSEVSIIASIALFIGYTVSINQAVDHGLGDAVDQLDDSKVEELSKLYHTANILLIPSIALAKASVTLFFIRVIGWKSMWKLGRYTSQGLLAYTALWALASIVTTVLQCSPTRWTMGPSDTDTCIDQYAMQLGIRIPDMITDLIIAILPVLLMATLQTNRKNRLLVITLFGVRAITIIPNIVSLLRLSKYYSHPTRERPRYAVSSMIWTSVWVFVSVTTACVPAIKQFLADWAAGMFKATIGEDLDAEYYSQGRSRPDNTRTTTHTSSSQRSMDLATKLGFHRSGKATVMSANRSQGGGGAAGSGSGRKGSLGVLERQGGKGAQRLPSEDRSESMRGLTEGVILQTRDYAVEYEEHKMVRIDTRQEREGSSSSSGEGAGPRRRS